MKKLFCLILAVMMICMCAISSISASAYYDEEDDGWYDEPNNRTYYYEDMYPTTDVDKPQYTVDSDFVDNCVIIILTKQASIAEVKFTADDFKDFGVLFVDEMSCFDNMNWTYRITLDKHDKQNVIDVIEKLYSVEEILLAEPNFIAHAGSSTDSSNSTNLMNAILAECKDKNADVKPEDITIRYACYLSEEKPVKCIVSYSQKSQAVSGNIKQIRLGEYEFSSPMPFPKMYINGKLYSMVNAYLSDLIDDNDLLSLQSFYDLRLVKVEKIGVINGDVDCSCSLDITDATYIQMILAKLASNTEIDTSVADYDGDGEISIMDATAIQMKLAKIE